MSSSTVICLVFFALIFSAEVGFVVAKGPSSVSESDANPLLKVNFIELLGISAFTLEKLKEKSCPPIPDGDERLCATGDGDLRVEKITSVSNALEDWQKDDTEHRGDIMHLSFSISAGGKGLSGGALSLSFSPIIGNDGKKDVKLIKAELTKSEKTTDISKPLIVDLSEALASEAAVERMARNGVVPMAEADEAMQQKASASEAAVAAPMAEADEAMQQKAGLSAWIVVLLVLLIVMAGGGGLFLFCQRGRKSPRSLSGGLRA